MSHEHDLPMQPDKKPVVPRSENEKEKIKNRLKKNRRPNPGTRKNGG